MSVTSTRLAFGFGVRGEMMSLNEFSAELMLQNMAQQGTKNIHRGLLEHVPLRSPCTSCDWWRVSPPEGLRRILKSGRRLSSKHAGSSTQKRVKHGKSVPKKQKYRIFGVYHISGQIQINNHEMPPSRLLDGWETPTASDLFLDPFSHCGSFWFQTNPSYSHRQSY